MCGINGIFAYDLRAPPPDPAELEKTRDHMARRGPDGAGSWFSGDRRCALGHRRLAIVDLSERGSQPMKSADGRYVVAFNGEIYNYPELRRDLEARGVEFRSDSDTEVLLHLYAREGQAMPKRLRGMFAFAIWDDDARSVFLARDPYGIKPLYFSNQGGVLRFASQVKALIAGGGVSRVPDPAGIVGFHLWGSVPDPFTLYRDIRALPAGASQLVDAAGVHPAMHYARVADIIAEAAPAPSLLDVAELTREALRDTVQAHLLADVEVGVFLSAGIDSGALLGLMRDAGQERVRAITLAFDEFRDTPEDEAPIAAELAGLYCAEHIIRRVSQSEFEADMPAILDAMDQPSIDGVNTWFASKAVSENGLKVALSGVGGDELFGGYPSFRDVPRMAGLLRWPSAIPGLGALVRSAGQALGVAKGMPKALGLLEYGGSEAGAYFLRRALFLPFELTTSLEPDLLRAGLIELRTIHRLEADALTPKPRVPGARIAALEASAYLRNQLLRDTDWAGMAHSVEIRTPLVDIELLRRLALAIPVFVAESGKASLAQAPLTPLPASIARKPKTGFSVPTGRWIGTASPVTAGSRGSASRAWAQHVFRSLMPPDNAPALRTS